MTKFYKVHKVPTQHVLGSAERQVSVGYNIVEHSATSTGPWVRLVDKEILSGTRWFRTPGVSVSFSTGPVLDNSKGVASVTDTTARVAANPYLSYSEVLQANKPTEVNRVSAVINNNAVSWVRDSSGTLLGGGWSPESLPKVEHFPIGTSPSDFQAALDAYYGTAGTAPNAGVLVVDSPLTSDTTFRNKGNILLRGDSEVSGASFYRKSVTNEMDSHGALPVVNDLIPSRHLKKMALSASPTIVVTGSSSATANPEVMSAMASITGSIRQGFVEANPDKTIKYHVRGIGGQTFSRLNSRPAAGTTLPSWYSNADRDWLDYISDLQPDVVVIIMGSNDRELIQYEQVLSVRTKIKGFSKQPDIIWVTQPAPSLSADPAYYSGVSTKTAQEGRDRAAGLIRCFAKFFDDGLMDTARLGNIAIDGFDPLDTAFRRVGGSMNLTGPFISPEETRDFSFRVIFNGDVDTVFNPDASVTQRVSFRVGAGQNNPAVNLSGDTVQIQKSPEGKVRLRLLAFNGQSSQVFFRQVDSTWDFPAAPFQFEIVKRGTTLTLAHYASQEDQVMHVQLRHQGGLFTPAFGYLDTTTGTDAPGNPFVNLQVFCVGDAKKYVPSLTSSEAWGEPGPTAGPKEPYGGNGVNHLSHRGIRATVSPLLQPWMLCADKASGEFVPVVEGVSNVASVSGTRGMWSVQGNIVHVSIVANIATTNTGGAVLRTLLPHPTNLIDSPFLTGQAISSSTRIGYLYANSASASENAVLIINTDVTTAQNWQINYTYIMRP